MPECRYCSESFDDDEAYLDHLAAEHYDELGRIDRRRVDQRESDGLPTLPLVAGAVIILIIGAAGVVAFGGGGQGGDSGDAQLPSPHHVGSVHYHGTINMTIDGERVDFTENRFKRPRENPAFHFEGANDPRWHVHAQDVTVAYALATLDIKVIPTEIVYDEVVYREQDPGIRIIIEVNGESVDPRQHVLADGDHIHIAVYMN